MTEQQAVIKSQNGDPRAFGVLYNLHIQGVYRFIYYKTHHKETAEDLTSLTFMKALEKIGTFNSEKASFKTWIYQIARNTVIDYYRQHHEVRDIEDIWDLETFEDIVRDTDTRMRLEDVQKYLKTLKAEQREIILLRVWGNRSFKEIAEITGKTEAACKMSFKRTIEQMRTDILLLILLLGLSVS